MQPPAAAGALKTLGLLAAVLAGILGIFSYLVPAGSYPVGFDAFWNLHVAKTWAESGFPDALPEAGFTQLAHRFADRQLGFHALLVLLFGAGIDESVVAPMVWVLAVAQGLAVFFCLRLVRRDASPLWLVLLPALSSTWMFRLTALRDMLVGILPLLVLVTLVAARPRPAARTRVAVAVATSVFGYVHGAVVLPVVLALVVCAGRRIRDGHWGLGAVVPVLAGLLPPLVLRPDFPHDLELLWTLNVRMPIGYWSGALPVTPLELTAPPVAALLRTSAPLVLVLALLGLLALRGRADWPLVLPAVALGAMSVGASRLVELAVPFAVIAAGAGVGGLPRALRGLRGAAATLAAVLVALLLHLPLARASADAYRLGAVRDAGRWLVQHGTAGDTVFLTDWGLASPLAWWTRGSGLRLTGITDPALMWAEDREAFAAWWRIKTARDPDPARTMASVFGARLLCIAMNDTAPGLPPGATRHAVLAALDARSRQGWTVVSSGNIPGLRCCRFDP